MACLHSSGWQFVLFRDCRTIGFSRSDSSHTVRALAQLWDEKSGEAELQREMLIFSITIQRPGELRQGWPGVFVLRGWEGDGR